MKPTRLLKAAAEVRVPESGFTVVEMMVAVTVSLFIIGALITVVLGSASTGRARDQATDLQVNGRYALEQIKNDLVHSGYLGVTGVFDPDQPISANGINVTGACDTNTVGKLSLRIWAANDANPYSATCIPAANYSQGDVLVVRGLSPTPVTAPFSATTVYYHSAYEAGRPFVGPTVPAPPTNFPGYAGDPKLDFPMQESVYYISPFTTAANESPLVPALYRTRLVSGPAMAPELVATGIENMQIRFGVFQTNNTTKYLNADETSVDDWDFVRSVQIWLLVRSAMPEAGYVNNNTYTLGVKNITVNDGYRRLLLSSVIELRN